MASDGGLFAFGDAGFYGSMGGLPLTQPVVGIAATPDGRGYWEVASDGGIFAFGDAHFYGSTGGPSTSTARSWPWPPPPTARATGWWPPTAASSPSVTPTSTARWAVSTLNQPIVGMAANGSRGYWLVAADGASSPSATPFYGSTGNLP